MSFVKIYSDTKCDPYISLPGRRENCGRSSGHLHAEIFVTAAVSTLLSLLQR